MSCVMQVQYDNKSSLLNSFILYELTVYYSFFIKKKLQYDTIQYEHAHPELQTKKFSSDI